MRGKIGARAVVTVEFISDGVVETILAVEDALLRYQIALQLIVLPYLAGVYPNRGIMVCIDGISISIE